MTARGFHRPAKPLNKLDPGYVDYTIEGVGRRFTDQVRSLYQEHDATLAHVEKLTAKMRADTEAMQEILRNDAALSSPPVFVGKATEIIIVAVVSMGIAVAICAMWGVL